MRAKLINPLFEKSAGSFAFEDIVNKKFIDLQEGKNGLNPYVSQYMHEIHNEYFDIDNVADDIINTEDFQKWLKYELEERFEVLKDLFYYEIIKDGYINLYRSMMVLEDYLGKLESGKNKRLGIYWTYDPESAEPHWGYNQEIKDEITFEIRIKEEFVNWIETFRLGLEHEFLNEEKEVRLFKNTPIDIVNISWNGKFLDEKELEEIKKYNYIA